MKKTITTPKGTELPLLDLKGKAYLPAASRIAWFREEHPTWQILTTPVVMNDVLAVFRADIVSDKGIIIAQAHKTETPKGFQDYVEKSETGAIGRALSIAGYGTLQSLDLDEGERILDTPINKTYRIKHFKEHDGKSLQEIGPDKAKAMLDKITDYYDKNKEVPIPTQITQLINETIKFLDNK